MLNLKHKQLDVWKCTLDLVNEVYRITKIFPSNENYVLVTQLRRAVISVASNLAEGSARNSSAERARFYEISRSSLVEIDTQIEISINLGYIKTDQLDNFQDLLRKVYSMITKMITVNKK